MVPQSVDRGSYVLGTGLVLFLLFWQWRTMPAITWDVTWRPGRLVLQLLFWLGWATALASTFMINHFGFIVAFWAGPRMTAGHLQTCHTARREQRNQSSAGDHIEVAIRSPRSSAAARCSCTLA